MGSYFKEHTNKTSNCTSLICIQNHSDSGRRKSGTELEINIKLKRSK